MRRFPRFVLTVVVAAAVVAAGIVGVVAGGVAAIGHATSAQAEPLPPLGTVPLEPSVLYAADGTTVLHVFQASARRIPVPLSRVSKTLIDAVLDTEDARFYIHGGFDIPSTLRAFVSDSSSAGGLQGGSTITQQLVKQTYLNSQRKLSRKIKEAVLADRLQEKYSKNQILQAYLNTIYFGNGAYGVQAAANIFFNTDVSRVTVAQAALLAGLIQNPNGYDPILDPGPARIRRSQVLGRMVHYGTITQSQADTANATALPTAVTRVGPPTTDATNNDYVQQIETQLLTSDSPLGGTYSEAYDALFEGGLKIYSNLNPTMQATAEQKTAADTPGNNRGFEEADVTLDPTTGKVLSMVGGSPTSQFDVVTQGGRQPGSGFKIFTLLAALEKGYNIRDTIEGSSPCAIAFPGDDDYVTHPATNDEGDKGVGVETLLTATAQSTNCAYLRLAHEVGLPAVIAMAHRLGISESIEAVPSIVLGATPVHPIEMAAAYATLADGGVYHAPQFVDHIVDRSGNTIYTASYSGHRVVSAQIADEATVAFQAVLTSGTAAGKGIGRPAAGKTGTTTNVVDAWFNGYTPQLETTVWMGSPAGSVSMTDVGGVAEVYGGTFPTTTWHDIMAADMEGLPVEDFTPPGPYGYGRYITSPGLVRDDHSRYFGGVTPFGPNGTCPSGDCSYGPGTNGLGTNGFGGTGTTAGNGFSPTTAAPPTSPSTAPTPTSVPPTTGAKG